MTRWLIWLLVMIVVVSVGASRLNGQTGDGGGLASTAPAAYPLAAKAAGIEGNVVVKGVIGKDDARRACGQGAAGAAAGCRGCCDALGVSPLFSQWLRSGCRGDDYGELLDG